MTYPPPLLPPPAADTPPTDVPVDEWPPYGDPPNWARRALVAGLVIAFLVLVVFAVRRWGRWLAALLAALRFDAPPERGAPMVIVPAGPYAGPQYRIRFYDGNYQQLTDVETTIGLDLAAPDARCQLAELARALQRRVELRDGQRCWEPRLELVDGGGRVVGEWP